MSNTVAKDWFFFFSVVVVVVVCSIACAQLLAPSSIPLASL
jgi:hypothetical protein